MTLLGNFLAILAVHWIGDFVIQTHWQATNKSKDPTALAKHVATYTITLLLLGWFVLGSFKMAFDLASLNMIPHWATDWCTSRLSARLYAKQDWHSFFVVIGLDQLIHQLTLAATLTLVTS